MKKHKTTRAATAAIVNDKSLAEAMNAEMAEWRAISEAHPNAIKAIYEFGFMFDICRSALCADKADRTQALHLMEACRIADDRAAYSGWCYDEFDDAVESGVFPEGVVEGLSLLRSNAPVSFAALEHLDSLLPDVLAFPKCPMLLYPAAMVRFGLAAVRDLTASRAA